MLNVEQVKEMAEEVMSTFVPGSFLFRPAVRLYHRPTKREVMVDGVAELGRYAGHVFVQSAGRWVPVGEFDRVQQ